MAAGTAAVEAHAAPAEAAPCHREDSDTAEAAPCHRTKVAIDFDTQEHLDAGTHPGKQQTAVVAVADSTAEPVAIEQLLLVSVTRALRFFTAKQLACY